MMKLVSRLDPVLRMAWRGLFSACMHRWLVIPQGCTLNKHTENADVSTLVFCVRSSLFGIQMALHCCGACTVHIYTIAALVWVADWCRKSVSLPGMFPRGPQMPLTWSSMQIYPSYACMPASGQARVPCIGIPVTWEVWEYAAVKQTSTIQLPKIALSQKRQCYFYRSVLNQPKYYSGARAIIQ